MGTFGGVSPMGIWGHLGDIVGSWGHMGCESYGDILGTWGHLGTSWGHGDNGGVSPMGTWGQLGTPGVMMDHTGPDWSILVYTGL